jgi:hypothetical protein
MLLTYSFRRKINNRVISNFSIRVISNPYKKTIGFFIDIFISIRESVCNGGEGWRFAWKNNICSDVCYWAERYESRGLKEKILPSFLIEISVEGNLRLDAPVLYPNIVRNDIRGECKYSIINNRMRVEPG